MVESGLHDSYLAFFHLEAATLILRVLAMYLFDKRMMFILAIVEILAISLGTVSTVVPFHLSKSTSPTSGRFGFRSLLRFMGILLVATAL
jgi:hypothetical protein